MYKLVLQGKDTSEIIAFIDPWKEDEIPVEFINLARSNLVRDALFYIYKHSNEKLTRNDVASQVYISQWYLSKLLHRETQMKFSDLLARARILKSRRLLLETQLGFGDIAGEVGFSDVSHFSRAFMKVMGMPPGQWRNQC